MAMFGIGEQTVTGLQETKRLTIHGHSLLER